MNKKNTKKIISVIFWIIIWIAVAAFVGNSVLLASPFEVVRELLGLLVTGSFYKVVLASLMRIGSGFFSGLIVGIVLAVLSYRWNDFEIIVNPVISLVKTVPVASFVVLLLIWIGPENLSYVICFLVVLPGIYLNTLEGLKATDNGLLEMAQVYNVGSINRALFIYRGELKPFLLGSMKVALGMGWKSGVAAEVIGVPTYSIGERLYMSKIYLDTVGVFAWTAVIIILSVVFEKLVLRIAEFVLTCNFKILPYRLKRENDYSDIFVSLISKSYGNTQVYSNFTKTVKAGEITYFTEPSGNGKTTLFRMICGLESCDEGKIRAPLLCSFMFQEDRLIDGLTPVKNVAIVTGDERNSREALLKLLDAETLSKPCRELSGGMRRRVALVRAMEADSDYVILDEPFTGMDEEVKNKAIEYIENRRGRRAVLIATHEKRRGSL